MGLFGTEPKVPNTISDKQMRDLQRRARKAAPPMVSAAAVRQRLNSNAQRNRAQHS